MPGWQEKGMFNEEQCELLLSFDVDPNQEFTLQEITNKLIEEIQKEKKPTPSEPQPAKKQTIYL